MYPTKDNCKIDWRTASWRRNGLLGRLSYAYNSCEIALESDFISPEDKVSLLLIKDKLKGLMDGWDRHYIKKLRKEVELKQAERLHKEKEFHDSLKPSISDTNSGNPTAKAGSK